MALTSCTWTYFLWQKIGNGEMFTSLQPFFYTIHLVCLVSSQDPFCLYIYLAKLIQPAPASYLDPGEDLDSAYNSVTSADIVLPTGKTDWVTLNVGGKLFKTTR